MEEAEMMEVPANDASVETYASEDFEDDALNYISNEREDELFDDGDFYADDDLDVWFLQTQNWLWLN